jgi:hypothetical protein
LTVQELKSVVQTQQQAALASSAEKSEKAAGETVTASVKPVMAASSPAAQRKPTLQPQAHIQVPILPKITNNGLLFVITNICELRR